MRAGPAAATMMSASRHTSIMSGVREWASVTVAVDALAAEQQHLRQPDQRRAADDDRPLAGGRDAVALEQPHHAERRARHVAGQAAHEPAHRALGEPVDVLLGRQQRQHRLGVEAVGQRQLARGCRAPPGRRRARRRRPRPAPGVASPGSSTCFETHAGLLRPSCASCARRSGSAGRRRPAPWPGTPAAMPAASIVAAHAGDGLVAQPVAVHQDGATGRALERRRLDAAHDRPTISPCSSKSMIAGRGRGAEAGHRASCRRRSGRRSRRRRLARASRTFRVWPVGAPFSDASPRDRQVRLGDAHRQVAEAVLLVAGRAACWRRPST